MSDQDTKYVCGCGKTSSNNPTTKCSECGTYTTWKK